MEKANIKETLNGNNNEKYITPYLLHKKLSDYTPGGGGGGGESTNKFDRIPVGAQLPFAGTAIPSGYLLCDGRAVSRTTYKDLFEVIGTTYGAGDGSTTFNLPDKRGRVSVGFDSEDSDFDTIGKTGGEKTHILKVNEIPSHSHTNTVSDSGTHTHDTWGTYQIAHASGSVRSTVTGSADEGRSNPTDLNGNPNHTVTINNTGGGQAHNNMSPYKVVAYWKRIA